MSHDELTLHFMQNHPADAARCLEGLPADEIASFLAGTPQAVAGRIVALLTPHLAAACMAVMPTAAGAGILQEIPADIAAVLLRRMDRLIRHRYLSEVTPARSAALRLALRYPDATVGSALDPDVLAFPADVPVRQIIAAVQERKDALPDHVYVTGENARLVGVVSVKRLLVAEGDDQIGGLAQAPEYTFPARASLESVLDHPAWRVFRAVPVIDPRGLLLGTVSHKAVSAVSDEVAGARRPSASDYADLMYALAETIWDACAEVFVRSGNETEREESAK